MSATQFLDTCTALRTGNQQLVVDMIFDNVDHLMTAKRYEEVNELMDNIDVTTISSEGLVAFLVITLPDRAFLSSRKAFVDHTVRELLSRGVEVADLE